MAILKKEPKEPLERIADALDKIVDLQRANHHLLRGIVGQLPESYGGSQFLRVVKLEDCAKEWWWVDRQ